MAQQGPRDGCVLRRRPWRDRTGEREELEGGGDAGGQGEEDEEEEGLDGGGDHGFVGSSWGG